MNGEAVNPDESGWNVLELGARRIDRFAFSPNGFDEGFAEGLEEPFETLDISLRPRFRDTGPHTTQRSQGQPSLFPLQTAGQGRTGSLPADGSNGAHAVAALRPESLKNLQQLQPVTQNRVIVVRMSLGDEEQLDWLRRWYRITLTEALIKLFQDFRQRVANLIEIRGGGFARR